MSKSQKEMNDMKINNNQNNYNHNYYNNPNMYMQPIQPQFVQNNYKNPFSGFDFNKFNSLFDEKAKKEYLGEIIYSQIYNGTLINDMPNKDQVVAKITGMILDIENIDEVMKISIDNDLLTKNVIDALNLLKNSNYDFNS